MNKLNVIHIVEALGGGVYSYFINLTHVLCEDPNLEVTVIYSDQRKEINPKQIAKDFHPNTRLISLPMQREISLKRDWNALKNIRQTLLKIKPNVLHLHSSKAGILGRFAYIFSPSLKVKLFYTPHGFSFLRKDIGALKRLAFYLIEFISQKLSGGTLIACGDTELTYAKKIGPALLVRNGIKYNPELKKRLKANTEIKKIGTLGRITYARNPGLFNKIALANPNINFVWIGDGELRKLLTALNIEITGWFNTQPEGLHELEKLDLYLQTSLWEGLPFALLEASAREIPILATNIIGNKDIITSGKTGFLFENLKEFNETLELLKPATIREQMGSAAAKRTALLFNSNLNFKKLISIYQA